MRWWRLRFNTGDPHFSSRVWTGSMTSTSKSYRVLHLPPGFQLDVRWTNWTPMDIQWTPMDIQWTPMDVQWSPMAYHWMPGGLHWIVLDVQYLSGCCPVTIRLLSGCCPVVSGSCPVAINRGNLYNLAGPVTGCAASYLPHIFSKNYGGNMFIIFKLYFALEI